MRFIADLHIHSKYSRATSPKLGLAELDRWADDKGILVMGTGDFTHPVYFKEMKEQLEEAEPGLYKLKKKFKLDTIKGTKAETRFVLSVEISSIYKRAGAVRKVHTVLLAPSLATVEAINKTLKGIGNIHSDGRPILGLDVRALARIVFDIDDRVVIIPAHIWTPWFSMFGSKSGFNSIEECFGDYTKYIFAVETGLSSDPVMNWGVSQLDNVALVSNSDSHSLERIGREANIFDTELSYDGIVEALKDNTPKKFLATIEYFPEEGRYHVDGHRKCGTFFEPKETRANRGICPRCKKPLTIGVLNRVERLMDRKSIKTKDVKIGEVMGIGYENRVPYINMVTLDSVLGEAFGVGGKSKRVKLEYDSLIQNFGNELNILMNIKLAELDGSVKPEIVEALKRVRERDFHIEPGYDGEYGKVKIFTREEKGLLKKKVVPKGLFD